MLNRLIEDNYKDILKSAKNISRRQRFDPSELINETYLTLHKRNTKVPESNTEFVKFFGQSMVYQSIDKYCSFRKANDLKQSIEVNDSIPDQTEPNEPRPDKETLQVLENSLPSHLKELLTLHYKQGLSTREIAKLLEEETGFKMSYVRISNMIKEIKYQAQTIWLRSI